MSVAFDAQGDTVPKRSQMHKAGAQALDLRGDCRQTGQELLNTEIAEGVAAFENADVQGHEGALRKRRKSNRAGPLTGAGRQRLDFTCR